MRGGLSKAIVALLGLTALRVGAKKDKPVIEETEFPSVPAGLFYFDDSDIIITTDIETRTAYRSEDAGVKWKPLDGVEKGSVLQVIKNPFDNQIAAVAGKGPTQWITRDQGKSWESFKSEKPVTVLTPAYSFHATDPDRILMFTEECRGFANCESRAYYTTDGFRTEPKLLRKDAINCIWAKSTDLLSTGAEETDKDRTLCVVRGEFSLFSSNFRLLVSDNFFKDEHEPAMRDGRTVSGIVNVAGVKSYIVVAAKSEGTKEMAMYVSSNGWDWQRAEFEGHTLEEDAYTLLESTNYSMQVDVMTTKPSSPMGVLLTSNSDGTFFRKNIEHTNRDHQGFVDFEKIQNIQGIVLVNIVDNWKDVEKDSTTEKKIKTQISFDDGRRWQPLTSGKDDSLQLHSITHQRNLGRMFSSPAPGIVMGIGNTGKHLEGWNDGDLFVSDDAGVSWRKALDNPHVYEIGDQGSILVAVEDTKTDEIKWSIDHGKNWEKAELPHKITPIILTTVPDSTSRKFTLIARKDGKKDETVHVIYALDFTELHERKCGDDDFEDWWARVDEDGKPTCIMGHTQKYRRRKSDANCFVDSDFKDPQPQYENCKCVENDYECDYENGFAPDGEKCVLKGTIKPSDECKDGKKKFKGPSGYRLIPGNTCLKDSGVELDKPVERDCEETSKEPEASGEVSHELTEFDGEKFAEYYYLERGESSSGIDETVIMRTTEREAWLSRDHGKKWARIVSDDEVVAIYPHQYINDIVYLITPGKKVYYSKDRGAHIRSFDAPDKPNREHVQIISFHPKQQDWIIWVGGRDCEGNDCQTIAHVSTKGGDEWTKLLRSVGKCQFIYREDREESEKLVLCEQYDNESPSSPLTLYSSSDWFDHKEDIMHNVINFATTSEYVVVASRDTEGETLKIDTSIDGKTFANAKFPPNFNVAHQQAYTVLDSSTHAVFLHVTVNNQEGSEYGSIVKSNSNGTNYVLSSNDVNRNTFGFVDFEKMQGLEGVAIINKVANVKEASDGASKKLKTYITHNDGADWTLLPRPESPPEGKKFGCSGGIDRCSLHLRGYTERKDPRDTFSSASAVGIMIGTGNVGEFLGSRKEADTFITRDGGVTWNSVASGLWMWEYGDQGSIIVIVKEGEPTKEVRYSLDEGREWRTYQFSKEEVVITDITTVPSDTSRNFLLWGKQRDSLITVNLDFSGLKERHEQCTLDENNPSANDYDLWSPESPGSDDKCLFGHVAEYHRKKVDRDCYNGGSIQHLHAVSHNCTCTRKDFECDYNFERQTDGSCALVEGLEPADPMAVCKNDKNAVEYFDITGYRRIPLTTCQGGLELDLTSTPKPCPGREEEFEKKHGISSAGLFFAIVIPIAAAAAVGYWVYRNWDGRFGRIQLGGDSGPSFQSGFGGSFDRDAPWVKYPVLVLSGVVAVVATLPTVASTVWGAVAPRLGLGTGFGYSRPFTTRQSFARGRGDYSMVDEDDAELLGDDSDDEV